MSNIIKTLALAGLAFVIAFAVACSSNDNNSSSSGSSTDSSGASASGATGAASSEPLAGATFSVGSKEFTEQLILGKIAVIVLDEAGAEVKDNTGIVGTDNVRAALESGEIDMYWEYTGTGWSSHLGREISDAPDTPAALADAVAKADADENGIIWYDTAPMNDTYALVTLASRADELGAKTISDYAKLANSDPAKASLCGATEWLTRDDGLPGLEEAYGFDIPDAQLAEVEFSLINGLVPAGDQCNFGEAFATDGSIVANDLVVLKDDKNYFVPYNVALTVRKSVDDQYGTQLHELFDPISAMITDETMQALNARVDVDGEDPEAVAESFLVDNGFIEE
jgi:osmoprotectant transport system substrate-binding protein